MVLVQHLLRVPEVKVVLAHVVPREVEHELQVVVLYAVLRSGRIVALELCKFLLECGSHAFRPVLRRGSLPQAVDFPVLVHAELLLDGAELVVQVILPLLLVDFRLHLGVDLLLDLEQFDLVVQG